MEYYVGSEDRQRLRTFFDQLVFCVEYCRVIPFFVTLFIMHGFKPCCLVFTVDRRMPYAELAFFRRKSLPCHVQLPPGLPKIFTNLTTIHLHRAILDKNGISPDNSKFSKPKKENVKILWDTSLQLPYAPSNQINHT